MSLTTSTPTPSSRGRASETYTTELLDSLRAHPGQWRVIKRASASRPSVVRNEVARVNNGYVGTIRSYLAAIEASDPDFAGRFEARSRTVYDSGYPNVVLEVRWFLQWS